MRFEEIPLSMFDPPPRAVDSDGSGPPNLRYPAGLEVTLVDGQKAVTTGIGWLDHRGTRNVQLRDALHGLFATAETNLSSASLLAIEKHRLKQGAAA